MRETSFDFWYRFVMPRLAMVGDGLGELVTCRLMDDVLASDDYKRLPIGECKYRSFFAETEAFEDLVAKHSLVRGHEAMWFALFSRFPVHEATARKYAGRKDIRLVTLDELYAG